MRVPAVVVAALLLLPAPAHAWQAAGQHSASWQEQALVGMARDFWTARNVTGCPDGVRVWGAPDVTLGANRILEGRGGDCGVWLQDSNFAWLQRPRGVPTFMFARLCTVAFHEVGHALGLPHAPSGVRSVMSADTQVVPWECEHWARSVTRAVRASASRRR